MATLNAVIVPAKALKGGKHKVRISVAHNGETRYIVTSIIIDSAKEFKNGQIVKRPDAAMKNTLLRSEMQKYQQAIDELAYTNGLTCAELVYQLKNAGKYKHRTCQSIYEEYIDNARIKPGTISSYMVIWRTISGYISSSLLMENVNHATILGLDKYLRSRKLKSTTIRNYLVFFMVLANYATRCGYVQWRVNPFFGFDLPKMETRDSWLSVDEVRQIRDLQTNNRCLQKYRDFFMLSYYLGGINMIDLLSINFNEQTDTIHYVREKTKNRPKLNKYVEFKIPDEAKPIIEKYKGDDGYIAGTEPQRRTNYHDFILDNTKKMVKATGIKKLIFYSARKSFSQHAFTLEISTNIIDYILGHRVDKGGTSLYSYISVTPDMATKAVRKVLDNLKG
jgi:hypothetical protein